MRLELKPDIVDDGSNAIHLTADKAGFTKDGLYSWVYKDSVLEIIYTKTNERFADWRFGKAMKDKNTSISCVKEFECSEGRMLLVATESLADHGMLCLFSFSKKRVVRAIEIPRKIRAVEIIFTNTKEDVPSWILSKHLHFFYGLAAVGTEGGFVYLVDLRLDDVMLTSTNEIQVKRLAVYSPSLIDPKAKRDNVCSNDKHMALLIDENCHRNEKFYHRRQDDSIDKVLEEDDVCVTCLKYVSQAGILAIGFNFGCFQLWRLYTPVLDYSSRFSLDATAISCFVVQEPENDPRNLVYIWVGRDASVMGGEHGHGKLSSIGLYQLCFNKKDTYPDFGLFYEDLESVCGRLDHNLQVNPYLGGNNQTTWSSQMVCAYTIINPVYTPPMAVANDSFEEACHGNDLSLSVFVWKADSKQSGHATCYWMAIFDLNRWYHAQMPHGIRCHGNAPQVCPYWAVYKLDDVVALSFPQSLLHVQITGNNVLKFINKAPLPPEEHSFPSALEITDVRFLTSQRTVQCYCYGWQGSLLQELLREGADHLVAPDSFYHQCLKAQLIPQEYNDKTNSVDYQRKCLLNLSLDYNLTVRLVHNCIHGWMDGEFVDVGCSLTLLLEWAWQAVASIKNKLDQACQILYDCSSRVLDSYTDWQIRRHYCSLLSLKQVFTLFLSQTNAITDRGQQELEMRLEVLRLMVEHHSMVQWSLIEGLLPETQEGEGNQHLFAYPYAELCRATNKRRAEFKALKGVVTNHSLLLIDGLMKCAGDQVASIWHTDGKDDLYPPTSMQSLMNLFLLEDVTLEVKQAVLLYFLQDLAAVLGCDDEGRQNVVVSFVRSQGILPSLVHTVHGLWCIDHRDYEEGLRQLVNPNVQKHSWSAWMDVAVVNTLLAQGQEATAARYMCSGHGLGATLEEQKLYIAVLVRNRKVSAAVDYMRQRCYHKKDPSDLMPFMLSQCQKNKMIGHLLQLHLLQVEELEVEKYLRDRSEPQALEPLLLYYLTHSRFVEAFTLNEEMNKLDKLEATCPAAREKAANRNRLMEAYLRVLPDITRKVLMERQHRPSMGMGKKVEVLKPKPLSTMVYKKDSQVISRSHLIMAVMDKVEEAMNAVEEYQQCDEDGEPLAPHESEDKNRCVYVATPLTPKHKTFASRFQTPEAVMLPPGYTDEGETPGLPVLPTNPLSAAKRDLEGWWKAGVEPEGHGNMSALVKECLDLLKTPIKGSRSEVSPKATMTAITIKTPQSILKVRRLSKSLLRSGSGKTPPDTAKRPKRLGFSVSDSGLTSPSSPSLESRIGHSHGNQSVAVATPKQLRFQGLSPSPSPSPSPVPVPVRSKESLSGADAISGHSSEEESQEMVTPNSSMVVEKEEESPQVDIGKDAGVTDVSASGEVEKSHQIETDECMEMDQSNDRDVTVTEQHKTTTTTTVMTSVKVSEESMMMESLEEGSSDRYDDKLGKLVRPDLQSPWKHDQSSEDVVTVDGNVTLHLTHVEGEAMTPTMTSSPVEEIPVTGKPESTLLVKAAQSILPVVSLQQDESINSSTISVDEKEETSTVRELHRNFLFSLVAPKSNISVEIPEHEKSLSSHSRLSGIRSFHTETTLTKLTDHSLRSRGESSSPVKVTGSKSESSPMRIIAESESPPATPPLSKRAKMIIRETRKSRFNLVTPRRELRSSSRTKEVTSSASISRRNVTQEAVEVLETSKRQENLDVTQEIDTRPRVRKTPERQSPSRSLKRKVLHDESYKEEEVLPQEEQSVSVGRRLRRTPDRKSPGRNVVKKVDEDNANENDDEEKVKKINEDDENKIDEANNQVVEEEEVISSRIRRTSERKSPARTLKRKADEEIENKEGETEQNTSAISARLRQTPDRKSPARNTRKNTVEEHNDVETVKDSEQEQEVERVERKSPARSVKNVRAETETKNESEMETESSSAEESRISTRQLRKTPERKSPSRSVRKKIDAEKDLNKDEAVTDDATAEEASGLSTRLRSSPAREVVRSKRSKTPERKTPTRKSRVVQEKRIIEEVSAVESKDSLSEEKEIEGDEGNKEEDEFMSGEDFVSHLEQEEEVASPSKRRRSTRLNTPERGGYSSQVLELETKARRSSRGRTTSVSSTADNTTTTTTTTTTTLTVRSESRAEKKKLVASTSPNRKEEVEDSDDHHQHNLRRSRRQSRTPERFRKEILEENAQKSKLEEEREVREKEKRIATPPKSDSLSLSSPSRRSTQRGRKSPGRSISKTATTMEETAGDEMEIQTVKRNLTEHLIESKQQDGVWSEELPPLRLEAEDEVDSGNTDQQAKNSITFQELPTLPQVQALAQSSKTVSVPSTSFVFSDPVSHTEDAMQEVEGQYDDDNVFVNNSRMTEHHGFVFSHPTVAEEEEEEGGSQTERISKAGKSEKKTTKAKATKSKRQRRNLLDSPVLLEVSVSPSQLAQAKKERSRVRVSEIQRASANVVRRYSRRSGVSGRERVVRVKPSSYSSGQEDTF